MARVIVIGAGIAGMSVAIGLRHIDIETLTIEQGSELGDWFRYFSMAKCVEGLARLGIDGPVRRLAIETAAAAYARGAAGCCFN